MRNVFAVATVAAVVLVSGCARVKVTTELKANGSFTRTVEFTGQAKQEGEGGAMQMGSSLEDTFALPSGAGWKSRETKKDSDRVITVTKLFAAAGAAKGDLTIKEGAGKLLMSNDVMVKKAGPSRWEYTETLRYTGTPPDHALKPEALKQIREALPKALATDANAKALAEKAAALAVPVLFGPGDPLLVIGIMHPELAQRRATQRLGGMMIKALEEQFGDKLSVADRRAVALKLIDSTFSSTRPSKPDPMAGPPTAGDKSGLIPLMFVLKGPGKLVSSNGEVDELTGEVYWALFPEAAVLKPVVLTAIWETK